MTRRPDSERIFVARRMGLLRRLEGERMSLETADRWIAAWEAEARSRGLDARERPYWDEAPVWIAEQRRGG